MVSLIDPKRKLWGGKKKNKKLLVPFSGNRDRFVIMALDLLLSEPLKESAFKSKYNLQLGMSMRCRVCKEEEEEEETVSLLHRLNKLFRCNDHCIFFGKKMVMIRQVGVYIGEGAPFLHLPRFQLGFYHQ